MSTGYEEDVLSVASSVSSVSDLADLSEVSAESAILTIYNYRLYDRVYNNTIYM